MVLVGMNECDRLIEEMDDWIKELQPLKSFILPMGSAPVAFLHGKNRCQKGREEACHLRSVEGDGSVRDEIICYLNRISDWLFVLGRWIAKTPARKRSFGLR